MRVLIAGGGTAGHINPALAIVSIIKEREPDAVFLYAGTPNGMESQLVPREGLDFTPISISGFQRKLSPENIARNAKAAALLVQSVPAARRIVKNFKPDIVIGTGGYVSGPVVFEAARMKIPTVIHEQNAYPGVTTRLLSKWVDKVMLTMEEAKQYFDKKNTGKCVKTGLPVRKGFAKLPDRQAAKRELGLDEDSLVIFSWGGSLGAGAINSCGAALMKWEQTCGRNISHIHSYGKMGHDTFVDSLINAGVAPHAKNLIIKEYIHNMDTCTAAADIIICRSGASAITELQAAGRASVLIPSPIVAGNHQYFNAKVLADNSAAILIEQKNLTDELIIKTVEELADDKERIKTLEENAHKLFIRNTNDMIYDIIKAAIAAHGRA